MLDFSADTLQENQMFWQIDSLEIDWTNFGNMQMRKVFRWISIQHHH